jgi:hypothetical protein
VYRTREGHKSASPRHALVAVGVAYALGKSTTFDNPEEVAEVQRTLIVRCTTARSSSRSRRACGRRSKSLEVLIPALYQFTVPAAHENISPAPAG